MFRGWSIIARAYTDKRKESNRAWDKENLDRLSIALPKGSRDIIKAGAKRESVSVNSFISSAILRALGLSAWPASNQAAPAADDPGEDRQ